MEFSSICAAIPLALVLCGPCLGETAAELRSAIHESLATDRLREASALLERYLEARPGDGAMHYNAACVHCRLGDLDAAGTALLESVKAGFLDFSHMRRDPDLDAMRDGKVYRALMAASDAADPLLADRRIREWQDAIDAPHRVDHDAERKLNYITTLPDEAHDDLRRRVESQADALVGWLFAAPLRHTVLIAIPTAQRLAELMPDAHAQGRYRHQFHELVSAPTGVALSHEMAHVFHHNHMDHLGQEHPLWIQEGLATLFETYSVDDDGGFVFEPNDRDRVVRLYMERPDRLPSLATLTTMTSGDFRRDSAAHYAQARSVFRFLAAEELLERWYVVYTDRFREDPTGRVALETVVDASIDEIDRRWRNWAAAVRVPAREPTVARTPQPQRPLLRPEPATDETPTRRSVTRLHRKARSLAAAGRHDQAIEMLRELLAIAPDHGDALYDLGLCLVLDGDPEGAREVLGVLRSVDPSLASLLENLVGRGAG